MAPLGVTGATSPLPATFDLGRRWRPTSAEQARDGRVLLNHRDLAMTHHPGTGQDAGGSHQPRGLSSVAEQGVIPWPISTVQTTRRSCVTGRLFDKVCRLSRPRLVSKDGTPTLWWAIVGIVVRPSSARDLDRRIRVRPPMNGPAIDQRGVRLLVRADGGPLSAAARRVDGDASDSRATRHVGSSSSAIHARNEWVGAAYQAAPTRSRDGRRCCVTHHSSINC